MLSIPVNTVRTRTRRGLEALRSDIERAAVGVDHRSTRAGHGQNEPVGWWRTAPALPLRWKLAAGTLAITGVVATGLWAAADRGQSSDPVDALESPLDDTASTGAFADRRTSGAEDLGGSEALGRTAGRHSASHESVSKSSPVSTPGAASLREVTETSVAGPIGARFHVIDSSGNAVVDADVFALEAQMFGAPAKLGKTDADGYLLARVPSRRTLVAARGRAGWSSRAVSVNRPSSIGSVDLDLVLERCDVEWLRLDGQSAARDNIQLLRLPSDHRLLGELNRRRGITGFAGWLPAWRDAAGRYGLAVIQGRSRVVATRDNGRSRRDARGSWAILPPHRAGRTLTLPQALFDDWTISGRLIGADGAPIPQHTVEFLRAGAGFEPRASTITDAHGRFELRAQATDRGHLVAAGLASHHVARADASTSVDIGEWRSDAEADEHGTRIIPSGPKSGPLGEPVDDLAEVRVYTKADKRRLLAMQLVEAPRIGTSTTTNESGIDWVPVPASDIAAVTIQQKADSDWTWIHTAPENGWRGTEIALPQAPLPSQIIVPSGLLRDATSLDFVHRASGVQKRFDLAPSADDQALLLSPGTWLLVVLQADGRTSFHRRLRLDAGGTTPLSALLDTNGTVAIDWRHVIESGLPTDELLVAVTESHEQVETARIQRSDLGRLWGTRSLPEGRFRIRALRPSAGGTPERYESAFTVSPGHRVEATPTANTVALSLVRPKAPLTDTPPTGALMIYAEDGTILESIEASEFHSAARFDLVIPRSPAIWVTAVLDGVHYKAHARIRVDQQELRLQLQRD